MLLKVRRTAGFTLVELVVTIIILSIISIVAYTRFPSISGYKLPAYCHNVKSALRRVQTQAMNDVTISSAYQVIVSPHSVSWNNDAIVLDTSANCVGNRCSQLVTLSQDDINRGIRFSANQFYFDSMGRFVSAASATSGRVEIAITAPQTSSEQVTVYQEGYIDGCE